MPMTDTQKAELELAFQAVRTLAEYDAAGRVTLAWNPGESPTVEFVPSIALEYVSVEFEVKEGTTIDVSDSKLGHIDCLCWTTGTYQRVEGCKYHPYDL